MLKIYSQFRFEYLLDGLKTNPSKQASRLNDFEIKNGFNWIFISLNSEWWTLKRVHIARLDDRCKNI